ncbi:unnamed protein product [Closterium sp. NIES-54]
MAGAVIGVLCVVCTPASYSPSSAAVWTGGPSVNAAGECQRELCVGPVLAWAEPTSWSGVREVQPTCSVGDADFGELVDGCGRPARGHCQAADFGTPAADIYEWSTTGSSTREGRRLGGCKVWVVDLARSTWQGADFMAPTLGGRRLGKIGGPVSLWSSEGG